MDNWSPFEEYSRASDELAIITHEQYNQARDAIAWRNKATEIYPNVSVYIDELIAKPLPQPTGGLI